jgi:hypothetical protein
LPLARYMQRQLDVAQEKSEARLVGALDAIQTDRQQIAGELDSQVLADLEDLGQRLTAAADRVGEQDPTVVREMIGPKQRPLPFDPGPCHLSVGGEDQGFPSIGPDPHLSVTSSLIPAGSVTFSVFSRALRH